MNNQEKSSGFIYPKVNIPIEPAINPLFNEIKEEVERWAIGHKLFQGESALQKLKREDVTKLGCHCCPESEFNRTVVVCKFLLHVVLLDDSISEGYVGDYYDTLLNYENDQSKVMEMMDAAENFPQDPITASFVDIWKQMKQLMNIDWQKRFAQSFIWYVKSSRWEIENRKHNRVPQLGEYLTYRYYVSGMEPCLMLVELMDNIILPDSVSLNPALQIVITNAANIIALENDLHSFEKEKHQ
ncbi:hypothetical protein B4U80_11945 [Leptotrombidium deliense]|uniref:Terpene synthase n=1 Tax=Leptotrombidium deliense TaxID=299467 RepID=A0A443S0K3_9ACAR|nr:hypothetical protein B4U80_11945 [Leptotrombidium deliense]